MSGTVDENAYRGLPGAIPYAFGRSNSILFKCYVLLGGLVATLLGIFFVLGFINFVAVTADTSATLAISRAFFVLIALAVVVPLLAPILLVARRHRRGIGDDTQYDRRLALSGFVFMLALYVGMIPTVPPEHQSEAGVITATLYSVPWFVGIAIIGSAAALIWGVHRHQR